MNHGQDNGGFTLIEVLLASALISMVALSIYLVFSQGLRVEARLQQGSLAGKDFFWTAYQIARDLERMQPYTFEDQPYFEGKADKLSFVVAGDSGLENITYQLVEPDRGEVHRVEVNRALREPHERIIASQQEQDQKVYELIKTSGPFLRAGSDGQERQADVLSDNILKDGLILSYRSFDEAGNPIWLEEWKEKTWPSVIRIDLTMVNDQHMQTRIVRDVFTGMGMLEGNGSREE